LKPWKDKDSLALEAAILRAGRTTGTQGEKHKVIILAYLGPYSLTGSTTSIFPPVELTLKAALFTCKTVYTDDV
jgi:hypothetical protein